MLLFKCKRVQVLMTKEHLCNVQLFDNGFHCLCQMVKCMCILHTGFEKYSDPLTCALYYILNLTWKLHFGNLHNL